MFDMFDVKIKKSIKNKRICYRRSCLIWFFLQMFYKKENNLNLIFFFHLRIPKIEFYNI